MNIKSLEHNKQELKIARELVYISDLRTNGVEGYSISKVREILF